MNQVKQNILQLCLGGAIGPVGLFVTQTMCSTEKENVGL